MADAELLSFVGTEVEGGVYVRQADYQAFQHDLQRLSDRVRRLVGKRLVLRGNRIITAYHANPREEARLLRDTDDRTLQN